MYNNQESKIPKNRGHWNIRAKYKTNRNQKKKNYKSEDQKKQYLKSLLVNLYTVFFSETDF